MGFLTRYQKKKKNTVQSQKIARDLKFRKYRNDTIYVAKTKVLISCTVTIQLICAFVIAYAKSRFSRDVANILSRQSRTKNRIL